MQSSSSGAANNAFVEECRQAAVYASGVLAMGGDEALTQIVHRAASTLRTPIAAIAVVERERQWLPAMVGVDRTETPRESSLSAHVVDHRKASLSVGDALQAPHFRNDPFVSAHPFIRFYAGAPLLGCGDMPIGVLCVMDPIDRQGASGEEEAMLRALAGETMTAIEGLGKSRRSCIDAIDRIAEQIATAVRNNDDALTIALDRILRSVERRMSPDVFY